MLRRKPLSLAVSAALAATTGLMLPAAYADDHADDEAALEEVVVTGSRIKTSVSDAPRPVTVMNRLDIELSGMESVADVLRNSSYNSLGSFRERSGSSFGQVALVDLRGLGANRTAILVNGRRVPGNPITGSSAVDLNSIPLSAVERIEVLTDSASAIYGADAIGGVINVIFRDDFEGFEFEIGGDRPTREGADSDHFNFTFGSQGEKSSVLFSGEWYKRNPIFDADRDYSRVVVRDNPNGGLPRLDVDTVGVSGGGNTGFATNFGEAFQIGGTCPGTAYIPISTPFGIPGDGCGFGYADLSMQTGGIDRQSTYLDARYQISDNHEVYFENRYSRIESFGRYAPAVGFIVVAPDAPLNDYDPDGDGAMDPFFLFHRFIGHGNRDDQHSRTEFDNILGLQGTLDVAGGINYDVYARHYVYRTDAEGDTYVLTSNIEDAIADGSYNFLNPLDQSAAHQAAILGTSATLFRDIQTEFNSFGLTLDGAFLDLPAGQIDWAAGFESAEERYIDQYDNMREAGNITGSAGNSSEGGRKRWAAFAEFQIPVLDNLDVNLAMRHDDYDDFGTEFSPQIAVRYKPIDQVTLRASWGEGFKAPDLGSIGQELSQSFDDVTDLVFCRANGIADANCPDTQVEQYQGGNPDLQAELSDSINIGIVVDPIDGLTFSVDWWKIEIEEAVALLDLQDVIQFEEAGTLPPGVIVNRDPTSGQITRCTTAVKAPFCGIINPVANLAANDLEGVDVRAQYNVDTDALGSFQARIEYSKLRTYDQQSTPISAKGSVLGSEGVPEYRYNFDLRWTYNDWTVSYAYHFIDGFEGATAVSKYDSYNTMDLNVTWNTPWNGEISVGARNLTDEDPEIDSSGSYSDTTVLYLYDVAGRVPYVSYKHFF